MSKYALTCKMVKLFTPPPVKQVNLLKLVLSKPNENSEPTKLENIADIVKIVKPVNLMKLKTQGE